MRRPRREGHDGCCWHVRCLAWLAGAHKVARAVPGRDFGCDHAADLNIARGRLVNIGRPITSELRRNRLGPLSVHIADQRHSGAWMTVLDFNMCSPIRPTPTT